MGKDHALHNEDICKFISENGEDKYRDWIVTTAFYSALHFVQHEMFPLESMGETYDSFNSYYNERIKKRQSKHEATIQLTARNLPTCHAQYRWLHDACGKSRYKDYDVSKEVADTAIANLAHIKSRMKK